MKSRDRQFEVLTAIRALLARQSLGEGEALVIRVSGSGKIDSFVTGPEPAVEAT
jgi:hypothetical protein